jgi:ATPase subunit of ABC transporter with duplicated ATPase domains
MRSIYVDAVRMSTKIDDRQQRVPVADLHAGSQSKLTATPRPRTLSRQRQSKLTARQEGAVISNANDRDGGPAALRVEGLHKAFDGTLALNGLSLTADHGEVVALFGPNGAGKTTAMRCVAGVLAPDAGSITVDGAPAGSVAAAGALSFLPEQPDLYASLTVTEHLRFVALAHRLDDWEPRASDLLDRFDLAGQAGHASRGTLAGHAAQDGAHHGAAARRPRAAARRAVQRPRPAWSRGAANADR